MAAASMSQSVRFEDLPAETALLATQTSKAPPPAAPAAAGYRPAAAADATIDPAQRAVAAFAEQIAIIQKLHRCIAPGGDSSSARMPNKVVKFFVLGIKYPYLRYPREVSKVDLETMFSCFEQRSVDPDQTVFGQVIRTCKRDQTIWVDCTSFGHINWAQHRGTHTNLVARLVTQKQLLERMFVEFYNKLRMKPVGFLQDDRPLVVIPYCDGGEHRSGAAAAVLAYCLHQDSWAVDPNFEYTNKKDYQMCGCADCMCSPLQREGPHYHSALDSFRKIRKGRLGF